MIYSKTQLSVHGTHLCSLSAVNKVYNLSTDSSAHASTATHQDMYNIVIQRNGVWGISNYSQASSALEDRHLISKRITRTH